ncbi:UNVERIFIED_ORG: muramoyltetrapeptide carboxypeptidase [Burkholderia contaminans]|nr:muramoyltetrapeptide carboxypeptidase [Burkholderia contaminans]
MLTRIRPRPHETGAGVGVFAPSLPLAAMFRDRFNYALMQLASTLQAVPIVADNVVRLQSGFCAGSARERAEELNRLIADRSVRSIICTIGGFNSAEMLPFVDYASARANPKILVGYSDCTALLLGLQAMAGWVTFHGPALMTQFGEYPTIFPYTLDAYRRAVEGRLRGWTVPNSPFWTSERLEWADGAWRTRARLPNGQALMEAWRSGTSSGVLWGGNLETVNLLAGTPYFSPPERDIVLFWEAVEAEAFLPRVRRALTHLQQCGVLERTVAMIVGLSPDAQPFMGVSLRETVLDAVAGYAFPVIGAAPIGHTDPMLTLPIGVRVEVSAEPGATTLAFLEEAVDAQFVDGSDKSI